MFAVGQRGDADDDPRPNGPDAFTNLLYRFDSRTGLASSFPQSNRSGADLLTGAGTQIVERGVLDTNTGGGPGGTITGLSILDGVLYALTDTGGLFMVNDPLSDSASLTYIRDVTPDGFANPAGLPDPIFGVLDDQEPNNLVNEAQDLDREIWTLREDPTIAESTTFKHISIYGRGDHGFLGKPVANNTGGLDGPTGVAIGSDGNVYVSSFLTDEVIRYDGVTGELIDVFVSAGAGGLSGPRGLAFDADGHLYVASGLTGDVLRYDRDTGLFVENFASLGLTAADGIAFDAAGRLFVASGDQIRRF